MRKRIYYSLAILISAMVLLTGCKESKQIESHAVSKQLKVQEEKIEEESEVRAAFSEEELNTEENASEEVTETEFSTEMMESTELTETTEELEESTEKPEESTEIDAMVASEGTYDYVALGNSITCNEAEDNLWWGNWGMAASSEEKDYIHLISAWLGGQSTKPVTTTVLDLKKWELVSDRDDILKDYEEYFNEYTDLVTIQTGENITDYKETLGSDYANLVKMIREKAPNAQILMLGEVLWPSEDIESAKHLACENYGITFVDMTDFLNGYESVYKSSVGTVVSGTDGESHSISNEVVAAHPNDEGMACIAQQVINQINLQK